jgi:hypothetical protein
MVLLVIILSFMNFLNGQPQKTVRFHQGYFVGLNSLNFQIRKNPLIGDVLMVDSHSLGIDLGLFFNYQIYPSLYLNMSIDFLLGSRNIMLLPSGKKDYIELSSIGIPLNVYYHVYRNDNVSLFIHGGVGCRYIINARKKVHLDNDAFIRFKDYGVEYNVGGGIEMYLCNVTFTLELNTMIGITDILSNNSYHIHQMLPLNSFKLRCYGVKLLFR